MTIAQNLHAIRIKAPFYQGTESGAHCGLHRYLDPDFINRFKQDMQRSQFSGTQFTSWQNDERHSRHGSEPVLRLPSHRAFHIVSCEVVCERLGYPALDPQKVTSAGFVIRKKNGNKEQAWMVEDGEALGWQDAPTELRDPDVHRRLCANGVLHKRSDDPAYTGEQVHPLHVFKSTQTLKDGTKKIHTLLFGYLPLGGFYFHRDPASAIDADSQNDVATAAGEALPWPFGYRKPLDKTWRSEHTQPIHNGRPSKAMFELLRLLVNRYHLGEEKVAGNGALEKYFGGLHFYDFKHLPHALHKHSFDEGSASLFKPYQKGNLFQYLKDCFAQQENNPLVKWIIAQEKNADDAGGLDQLPQLDRLPQSDGTGTLHTTLQILASDAQEIRTLLDQRLRSQTLAQVKEIPLPKFTQNASDLYQVIPFVRHRNDHGKEQIQWADASARSILFRVAAPFDPEASRPSLIQMPSLADLKRGMAKGVAMITPGDTFNLMNSIKFNKGISEDALPAEEPKPGLDIQWICSFSLPVVTLIAMLILMIMISLLNIIFFWMPWVRICLPFPKMK